MNIEPQAKPHPLLATNRHIADIFQSMGFTLVSGPELDSGHYIFDVLNVPGDHPSRDMQDTFWVDPVILGSNSSAPEEAMALRTHTTSVTARILELAAQNNTFPCACVSVGKVFRNEATDATHEMQFHQVDGAVIGQNITLADLRSCLTTFYRTLLGDDIGIKFRPSFFPFVEPGLEVWVENRKTGKYMEVMGAGMLHPNVLRNLGIDTNIYQGFAFGGGTDRITMAQYRISDLRYLYQGDLRVNQW